MGTGYGADFTGAVTTGRSEPCLNSSCVGSWKEELKMWFLSSKKLNGLDEAQATGTQSSSEDRTWFFTFGVLLNVLGDVG